MYFCPSRLDRSSLTPSRQRCGPPYSPHFARQRCVLVHIAHPADSRRALCCCSSSVFCDLDSCWLVTVQFYSLAPRTHPYLEVTSPESMTASVHTKCSGSQCLLMSRRRGRPPATSPRTCPTCPSISPGRSPARRHMIACNVRVHAAHAQCGLQRWPHKETA